MTRLALRLVLIGVVSAGCERHEVTPQVVSARPKVVESAPPALPPAPPRVPCITQESVGAVALAELKGEGANELAAIAAARRELKRVLEVPEDYFASVQTAGDLVLLELWHRSAFLPENCDASEPLKRGAAEPLKRGADKRCAKCRTVAYDPKLRRIVSTKVWEQASD